MLTHLISVALSRLPRRLNDEVPQQHAGSHELGEGIILAVGSGLERTAVDHHQLTLRAIEANLLLKRMHTATNTQEQEETNHSRNQMKAPVSASK